MSLNPASRARLGLVAVLIVLLGGMARVVGSAMTTQRWAAEPGRDAADFTLPTDDGKALSLNSFHGRPLTLVVMPVDHAMDAPTRLALEELTRRASASGHTVLAVAPEPIRTTPSDPMITLVDRAGNVAGRYLVLDRPTVFLISAEGKIEKRVALDHGI
jgi:peroxiredoxin